MVYRYGGTLDFRMPRESLLMRSKVTNWLVERIADRVTERVAHLLDERLSLIGQRILDAKRCRSIDGPSDCQSYAQGCDEPGTLCYARLIGELPPPQFPPMSPRRRSELCKQADFSLDAYRYWSSALGLVPALHRKHWEFFYLCQALYERELLELGRTGLGFGVGREPLPALFASRGCNIVATDQAPDDAVRAGWQGTGQHADGLAALERPDICASAAFRERVSFEIADMNDIPAYLNDRFDFCWSACCLEHLGSLEHGLRFIENSINTLKLGGIAVHTTEFNLTSDLATLESRDLSIYRRCDIEALAKRLERAGHHVEPLDFTRGNTLSDGYVDLPPYHNEPHLRLRIGDYDCTSLGLIITRRNGS
jgi:hypothetical protein